MKIKSQKTNYYIFISSAIFLVLLLAKPLIAGMERVTSLNNGFEIWAVLFTNRTLWKMGQDNLRLMFICYVRHHTQHTFAFHRFVKLYYKYWVLQISLICRSSSNFFNNLLLNIMQQRLVWDKLFKSSLRSRYEFCTGFEIWDYFRMTCKSIVL